MTLLSFHNDPAIKEKYLARVKAHEAADEIIKGIYWENGKGCAVGCTIHSNRHDAYETQLGISQILAMLEDRIFENLPNMLARIWPRRFLGAIPVGKDLSRVWQKFMIFILTDPSQCASRHPQCIVVADHFRNQLDGQTIDWSDAREAAWCATSDPTSNAAWCAAWYAASAAWYIANDAVGAASGDATSAAESAARADWNAWAAQSEKLLELLRDA